MHMSDWSSDVCSADLADRDEEPVAGGCAEGVVDLLERVEDDEHEPEAQLRALRRSELLGEQLAERRAVREAGDLVVQRLVRLLLRLVLEVGIGRASSRERVCQYV